MKAKDLRNSILMMAVQGKLVEQNPHDEPAVVLLEKIRAEKEELIKQKKIKKEKSLPEITDEEKLFDLPAGWEWVRLGELASKIGAGSTPTGGRAIYGNSGIKFIRSQNVYNDGLRMDDIAFISEEINNKKRGSIVFPQDILLNITGGSIGRCALVPDDFDIGNVNQHVLIVRLIEKEFREYIHLYLISPYIQKMIMDEQVGVSREGLSATKTTNFLVALPPIAEQQRIVAKLEELMPKIDKYEQAETTLTSFEQAFPDKLRSSILQAAVQGKLVAQNSQDEPASVLLEKIRAEKAELIKQKKIKKEKPLPEIMEEEKPFDLPAGWEWVHLNDILDVRDGTHDTPAYVPVGVPLVTSKNLDNGKVSFANIKYISKEDSMAINQRSGVDNGDILFAMIGSIGNPVVVYKEKEFSIKNVALFKNAYRNFIDINFIYYVLIFEQDNMKKMASGGVQAFVSLTFLRKYVIALPPLAEQKRIVAKVEKMLSLCDCLQEA